MRITADGLDDYITWKYDEVERLLLSYLTYLTYIFYFWEVENIWFSILNFFTLKNKGENDVLKL